MHAELCLSLLILHSQILAHYLFVLLWNSDTEIHIKFHFCNNYDMHTAHIRYYKVTNVRKLLYIFQI